MERSEGQKAVVEAKAEQRAGRRHPSDGHSSSCFVFLQSSGTRCPSLPLDYAQSNPSEVAKILPILLLLLCDFRTYTLLTQQTSRGELTNFGTGIKPCQRLSTPPPPRSLSKRTRNFICQKEESTGIWAHEGGAEDEGRQRLTVEGRQDRHPAAKVVAWGEMLAAATLHILGTLRVLQPDSRNIGEQ